MGGSQFGTQPGAQPQMHAGLHNGLHSGANPGAHQGHGRQAGVSEFIEEIAGGGNGLNSLSRLLNFEDTEFWKGALVGAAAVMLLTNESVQSMLFKGGKSADKGASGDHREAS